MIVRLALVLLAAVTLQAETYTYWIESCTKPESECESADEQLAEWAIEAWQEASKGGLKFVKSPLSKARIRVYWASPGKRGFYGEARAIEVEGKPGAEVEVRPDLQALGHKIEGEGTKDRLFRHSIVYLTCLHEIGHALGLDHTTSFRDIMYTFEAGGDIIEYFRRYRRLLMNREDIRVNPGLSPEDRRRLLALYSRGRRSGSPVNAGAPGTQ